MTHQHLSDEQIQNYLDQQNKNNAHDIQKHLDSCPRCQRELKLYKELYTTLQSDMQTDLSADFSDKVVNSIGGARTDVWERYESGFFISLILVGLAVSFYFINPLPFLAETGRLLLSNLPSYGSELLSKLNGNLPFVLIALFIFFLVEIFDKKILKPKI